MANHQSNEEGESSDFPDRLRLRAPRGLPAAVKAAARRRHTCASEWMRQTLLRGLQNEGVSLSPSGQVMITEPGR